MALIFYPHAEDVQNGSLADRVEVLMDAASRFKAAVLEVKVDVAAPDASKRSTPRDQAIAFNWEEIAVLLREIRDSAEASKTDKVKKADLLTKLADVYEVLRGAKMSKLEAVRLALISEANQLRGEASQVA